MRRATVFLVFTAIVSLDAQKQNSLQSEPFTLVRLVMHSQVLDSLNAVPHLTRPALAVDGTALHTTFDEFERHTKIL